MTENTLSAATALIADDETHLSRFLKDSLAKAWPELQVLAVVPNGLEAAKQIEALQPDVAFLDIQMPGLTGLEVAQGIESNTLAVFVTAYDQYAVQAFDDGAVDYLLKPVTADRLAKCVERVKARLTASKQPISEQNTSLPLQNMGLVLQKLLQTTDSAALQTLAQALSGGAAQAASAPLRYVRAHERNAKGEQVLQIDVSEVLYFDAADKYTCVVLPQGEKLLRTSVSELEALLDPSQFKRIHRSTLVNLAHVHASHRDESGRLFLRMKNHSRELPVSRAYHDAFSRM